MRTFALNTIGLAGVALVCSGFFARSLQDGLIITGGCLIYATVRIYRDAQEGPKT